MSMGDTALSQSLAFCLRWDYFLLFATLPVMVTKKVLKGTGPMLTYVLSSPELRVTNFLSLEN